MSRVRIAVAGAGLIGKRHIEEVDASAAADLAAIVDPCPSELAVKYGVPQYQSLAALFGAGPPDGVILATPNQLHVEGGLECVAAGVPVIVEKPVGDTVEGATRLVEAGEAAGVPVLTGHHRNYSPIMARAREIVRSGALGRIVAVTGTALFHKPDQYFEVGGGGPVRCTHTPCGCSHPWSTGGVAVGGGCGAARGVSAPARRGDHGPMVVGGDPRAAISQ